jgi:uncharacterized protein
MALEQHELTVPLKDLESGAKEYDFALRAEWMRGALSDADVQPNGKDGSLRIRLTRTGRDVVAQGRIEADVTVACARCLGPAHLHLAEDVTALFVPAADARHEPRDDGHADRPADDLDLVPYEGETLVLDDLARDELLLALPMIPLCSEDCPGMSPPPAALATSPSTGKDGAPPAEDIDPRLRPLLRIKARKE